MKLKKKEAGIYFTADGRFHVHHCTRERNGLGGYWVVNDRQRHKQDTYPSLSLCRESIAARYARENSHNGA